MNRTEKSKLAAELKDQFGRAKVALFADYKGLTAVQADNLRKAVRAHAGEVKVLKNNIGRLVAKNGDLGPDGKNVMDRLVGPTMVAFTYGDPAALAKTIHKFSRENEAFKLKDSLMASKLIKADEIEQLASLPSREVMIAKFLGTLNAPVSNFVGVLAAVPRSLVTVLSAIEKKKAGA